MTARKMPATAKAPRKLRMADLVKKKVAVKKTTLKASSKAKAPAKAPAKKRPSAVAVPRVTKKVIKKAAPLSKEEKEQLKLEREKVREERNRIKEERARIRAEKERVKQEKLRMWELVPTTSVTQIKTNPLLTKVPSARLSNPNADCCIFCNNRAVMQAAVYKDLGALKTLLADYANISNPLQKFGIDCCENLLRVVVKQRDFESFKLVIDYMTKNKQGEISRVKLPQVALTKKSTGQQNTYSHNFPMRQVKLSRGGKEGNNAFTYDKKLRMHQQIDHTDILKLNPPMNFVKYMLSSGQEQGAKGSVKSPSKAGPFGSRKANFIPNKNVLSKYWAKAVRKGNFPLVKYLFEENKK